MVSLLMWYFSPTSLIFYFFLLFSRSGFCVLAFPHGKLVGRLCKLVFPRRRYVPFCGSRFPDSAGKVQREGIFENYGERLFLPEPPETLVVYFHGAFEKL